MENFVIDIVKTNILTELVRLTNEEMSQAKNEYEEWQAVIDGQLRDLRGRLHKLYNALEPARLEIEDLTLRIKKLKAQIDNLEQKRFKLVENIQDARVEPLEASAERAYVDDLKPC